MLPKAVPSFTQRQNVLVMGFPGFVASSFVLGLKSREIPHIASGKRKIVANTSYRQCNVNDVNSIQSLIEKISPTSIIYCVSYNQSIIDGKISKSFSSNTKGLLNVCEAIRLTNKKIKLVVIGSRLEYGKMKTEFINEESSEKPTSVYGTHKLISTHIAKMYAKLFELKIVILRVSNLYGPHNTRVPGKSNILNYLISRAINGKNLIIYGQGKQLRDYIYIDDFVELVLDYISNGKLWSGDIINIGSGNSISLVGAAKIISQFTNVNIIHKNWPKKYQIVETGDYKINNSKMLSEFKILPKHSFESGVKETIDILYSKLEIQKKS